jgi:hypothetical protein
MRVHSLDLLRTDVFVTSAILNLCMPYASRDEVTTAINFSVEDSLKTNQYEVSYVATSF